MAFDVDQIDRLLADLILRPFFISNLAHDLVLFLNVVRIKHLKDIEESDQAGDRVDQCEQSHIVVFKVDLRISVGGAVDRDVDDQK